MSRLFSDARGQKQKNWLTGPIYLFVFARSKGHPARARGKGTPPSNIPLIATPAGGPARLRALGTICAQKRAIFWVFFVFFGPEIFSTSFGALPKKKVCFGGILVSAGGGAIMLCGDFSLAVPFIFGENRAFGRRVEQLLNRGCGPKMALARGSLGTKKPRLVFSVWPEIVMKG